MHSAAPVAFWYLLGAQAVHARFTPAAAENPATHSEHAPLITALLNVPAVHWEQVSTALLSLAKPAKPALHSHAVSAVLAAEDVEFCAQSIQVPDP